jgi:hypothetical protein
MFYPLPTSSQLAQHDAWLEEGRKEPSYPVAKPARIRVRRRLLSRVGKWLVSAGLRLQARYGTIPPVPEASPSPSPS